MANKKSSQYPYQWPDGSWHSTPWITHQQNLAAAAVRSQGPGAQIMAAGDAYYKATGTPNPNAPQAPAAPAVMPQPFDPNFELGKLQAGLNVGLANSEGTYQAGRTAYSLGINEAGQFDPSNPYSQAQSLEDNYKRSLTGTLNSYAAQGQRYSGAYDRAQARNDRLYAQSSAGLRDQARDTYHGIRAGQLQTYASNAQGIDQGAFDALRKAIYGG